MDCFTRRMVRWAMVFMKNVMINSSSLFAMAARSSGRGLSPAGLGDKGRQRSTRHQGIKGQGGPGARRDSHDHGFIRSPGNGQYKGSDNGLRRHRMAMPLTYSYLVTPKRDPAVVMPSGTALVGILAQRADQGMIMMPIWFFGRWPRCISQVRDQPPQQRRDGGGARSSQMIEGTPPAPR